MGKNLNLGWLREAAVRFLLIYYVIQIIPLDWKFYGQFVSIDWLNVNFYDLLLLTRYMPQFLSQPGLANLGIAAVLSALATSVWYFTACKKIPSDTVHYWLRVLLRYRLALGVIVYGLIKLFPLQVPYPSLSNLHTNYGDFYAWKIYFHTLGIVPWYESIFGIVEIGAGLLLLSRNTTTLGAGILIGYLGNVFISNVSYTIGDQVYSAFLLSMAVVLFVYDAPRLYNLLALERFTEASHFQYDFTGKLRQLRTFLKWGFVAGVILFGSLAYANYTNAPYKYPKTRGLEKASGFYNVREFKYNGKEIPYSRTDSVRWQNVIFEEWATLSIKTGAGIVPDTTRGEGFFTNDHERDFEVAGVGDRRYFSYEKGASGNSLVLKNKNKNHQTETFKLAYTRPDNRTIIVQGVNEKRDSVYAVLEKIEKKYMMIEGRQKPVKL